MSALLQVIADAARGIFIAWLVTVGHFFASLRVVVLPTSPDAVTIPAAGKQGFSVPWMSCALVSRLCFSDYFITMSAMCRPINVSPSPAG